MKVSFSVKGLMDFPPSNIQKAAAINGLKILSIIITTTMGIPLYATD